MEQYKGAEVSLLLGIKVLEQQESLVGECQLTMEVGFISEQFLTFIQGTNQSVRIFSTSC